MPNIEPVGRAYMLKTLGDEKADQLRGVLLDLLRVK